MELSGYLRAMRRRWLLIAAFVLLGVGTATLVTHRMTRIYRADAQVFVATNGVSSDYAYQGGLFTEERVKSYAAMVNSPPITQGVISSLHLHTTPERLGGQISAEAPLDTDLINIAVDDREPRRAQAIANATATELTRFVAKLERTTASGQPLVKVSLVRPASLPSSPASPQPNLNLALGLVLGLVFGVAAAAVSEALNTSVRTPEDVARHLGRPVVGVLPVDRRVRRHPLMVRHEPRSRLTEAFRQLRTNLQFPADSGSRSIVVASALPGEGRTTTAVNLALSLTQAGVRVVLVEGDLRRPRISDVLGLRSDIGLSSVLTGMATLDEALQNWGGGLQVLAAGPLPTDPSELVGSAHMAEVLRSLEGQAPFVLIDTPPVSPVTDAAALAAVAGTLLLVVRAGRTPRSEVRYALEALDAVGARTVGVVLNMAAERGPDIYGSQPPVASRAAVPPAPKPAHGVSHSSVGK